MTTIIGIKSIDPKTNEPYAILASDTRGIHINKYTKRILKKTDVRKIIKNQDNSLVLTACGERIAPEEYVRENLLNRNEKQLIFSKSPISESEIKYYLMRINKFKENNSYILIQENPFDMVFFNGEYQRNRILVIAGSGAEVIEKEKVNDLEKKVMAGLKPIKAINWAFELIRDASKKDEYTGGYFNWVLKTPTKYSENKRDFLLENPIYKTTPLFLR